MNGRMNGCAVKKKKTFILNLSCVVCWGYYRSDLRAKLFHYISVKECFTVRLKDLDSDS